MEHEHRLTIHIGLTADTLALVREIFNPPDVSKLAAALPGFEAKIAALKNSIINNTPTS